MRDWMERFRTESVGLQPRTLVELYGNERVLIEEHRGILGYGAEQIRVGASFGLVMLEGTHLHLCCMSRSQLVVRGRIASVRMEVEG